jgi:hypothetical protein
MNKQLSLGLNRGSRPTKFPEVDLSHHDFGPEFGYYYRTPIQLRPEGGMAYRYGRPNNAVTAGHPIGHPEIDLRNSMK